MYQSANKKNNQKCLQCTSFILHQCASSFFSYRWHCCFYNALHMYMNILHVTAYIFIFSSSSQQIACLCLYTTWNVYVKYTQLMDCTCRKLAIKMSNRFEIWVCVCVCLWGSFPTFLPYSQFLSTNRAIPVHSQCNAMQCNIWNCTDILNCSFPFVRLIFHQNKSLYIHLLELSFYCSIY